MNRNLPLNRRTPPAQQQNTMDRQQTTINFRACPFSRLIKRDRRLAELRLEYADRPAEERREAAEWAYDESIASRLFNRALALAGRDSPVQEPWPDGIAALAIDPTYAPAMLTGRFDGIPVGPQRGGHGAISRTSDAAGRLPELEVIIDKAGDYLLSEKDLRRAADFYASASEVFPTNTAFLGGLGYCLGEAAGDCRRPPPRPGARPKKLSSLKRPWMGSDRKRPMRRSGSSPAKGHPTCAAGRRSCLKQSGRSEATKTLTHPHET